MDITYETLTKLIYLKEFGVWKKKSKYYVLIDKCETCGNEFLAQTNRKDIIPETRFCTRKCQNTNKGENNSNWKGGVFKNNRPTYIHYKDRVDGFGIKCNENKYDLIQLKCMSCNEWFIPDVTYLLNILGGYKRLGRYKIYCSKRCLKELRSGKNNPNWKGGVSGKQIPYYDTYAPQLEWCEKVRKNKDDVLDIKCTYCGKWFIPSIQDVCIRIQAINGKSTEGAENRLYCSDGCKQECPVFRMKRYPKDFHINTSREVQPELRQMVFKRDGYQCTKCNSDGPLNCHHIEGILWEPLQSADMDICVTVCKSCHLKIHQKEDCGYHDMKCNK